MKRIALSACVALAQVAQAQEIKPLDRGSTPAYIRNADLASVPISKGTMTAVKPRTCAAVDSVLGPAIRDALKGNVAVQKDSMGKPKFFRSGKVSYRGTRPPPSVTIDGGPVPPAGTALITLWFSLDVLEQSRTQAEPIVLTLDDSVTVPLGTPRVPILHGNGHFAAPFSLVLRPDDFRRLALASKSRATFYAEEAKFSKDDLRDIEAAFRTATCTAADGKPPADK